MMKTYGWLGIGILVVALGWNVPTAQAQAQATGAYSPTTSMFQTTGVQRSPALTANYYGLVQNQTAARKDQVLHAQQHHQAQVRAQAGQRTNVQASFANLPWFATNWVQVRPLPAQGLRRGRR